MIAEDTPYSEIPFSRLFPA